MDVEAIRLPMLLLLAGLPADRDFCYDLILSFLCWIRRSLALNTPYVLRLSNADVLGLNVFHGSLVGRSSLPLRSSRNRSSLLIAPFLVVRPPLFLRSLIRRPTLDKELDVIRLHNSVWHLN